MRYTRGWPRHPRINADDRQAVALGLAVAEVAAGGAQGGCQALDPGGSGPPAPGQPPPRCDPELRAYPPASPASFFGRFRCSWKPASSPLAVASSAEAARQSATKRAA